MATNTAKYDREYSIEKRKRPITKEEMLKALETYIEERGYKPNEFKIYRLMTVHDEEAEPLTHLRLETAINTVRRNIKAKENK
ncbi:hypothetical protein [Enterobacter pseudoroggenkampii]|uniref:hypothetical protein n=1 Tax=Enterobacter pseudoroggenkampii TaxID=2996112 RepID=UPI002263F2EC|nr:hypothetical protein [Enterobacter pseudoroggenkampii]MCX8289096.1 hypothetical protein [Enterobacter pseudoroggenkampii]